MIEHTVLTLGYSGVLSQMVRERYPHFVRKHGRYENVYHMVSAIAELRRYHLQVAFCYLGFGGEAVRHAFCVADGNIVEPIQIQWLDTLEAFNHITVIRLLEREEYLAAVHHYGYYDLWEPLLKDEILTLKQNRIEVNPVDLAALVARVSDTPGEMCEKLNHIATGDWCVLDENYGGPGLSKSRPPRGNRL